MLVSPLTSSSGTWLQIAPVSPPTTGAGSLAEVERPAPQTDFGRHLTQALDTVNTLQLEGDRQAQMVATGQCSDLNAAVMAVDKAALALQLTVAVTNRALEAYKEVSRMQF